MISELISTILQLFVFTLIPFLAYIISKRKAKGVFEYIGLKKSNRKANMWAVITSLIFFIPPLLLVIFNNSFFEIMNNSESMTGKFREMGFGAEALFLIIIIAVFKTSLAEEILFRGFVAKRLIAITSYKTGNILQTLIFGAIHTALFLTISSNVFFLAFIFVFPALGAYVSVYINEKLADGSIIPGWISHGLANVLSYSIIGFLVYPQ
ncbi:MAG: CPBP family intramembrane glutamic endopeptidase [Balneola sp.]